MNRDEIRDEIRANAAEIVITPEGAGCLVCFDLMRGWVIKEPDLLQAILEKNPQIVLVVEGFGTRWTIDGAQALALVEAA